MDDIDRAQAWELELWEARQRAASQRMDEGPSALECEDCGEPIPEARRIAVPHCVTCIDCKRIREKT